MAFMTNGPVDTAPPLPIVTLEKVDFVAQVSL